MNQLHALLKAFDAKIILGNVSTLGLLGISATNIEVFFRIASLLIACAVGIVTYKYTQEKRKFLKLQSKETEE